jgi:hypothetical protein
VRQKKAEELKENEETDRAEGGGGTESAALSSPCAFVDEHSTPCSFSSATREKAAEPERRHVPQQLRLRGAQSASAKRSREDGRPCRRSRQMACLR